MVALNGKALRPTAHGTAPSAPKVDALAKIRTSSQAATFVTLGEAVSNGAKCEACLGVMSLYVLACAL